MNILSLMAVAALFSLADISTSFASEETALPSPGVKPYDKSHIGENSIYAAKYEDTLIKIARSNNLGFVALRAANPHADPWLPGEGTHITIPGMHLLPKAPRNGVVVNLPEMRLYAYVEEGKPPVSYPIGVGRVGLETPMGKTKVIKKTEGPIWYPTARMREEDPELPASMPAGPDNPLGTHALYLGWPEYAIHGTNRAFGIGRRVSSGCVRLYPEDIIELYDIINVGTEVYVVDQPVKVAWVNDELYLEANLTLSQADDMENNGGIPDYKFSDSDMQIILSAAGEHANSLDWQLIRKAIRSRNGYPVVIARRETVNNDIELASTSLYEDSDSDDNKKE
jgi:L,D-transpeptidase ErfK/SrfK